MLHKGTICLIFCVFNVELVEKSEDILFYYLYRESDKWSPAAIEYLKTRVLGKLVIVKVSFVPYTLFSSPVTINGFTGNDDIVDGKFAEFLVHYRDCSL